MPGVCSPYQNFHVTYGLASHKLLEPISAAKNNSSTFLTGGSTADGTAGVRISATPSSGGSDVTNNGSGAQWSCEYCDRKFDTKSGLGVHKSRSHREEWNLECLTATQTPRPSNDNHVRQRNAISSRRPWTDSEITALAKLNLEMHRANPNMSEAVLNKELAKKFPGRSTDAIKGQKKGQTFRDAVARICEAMETDEPGPNHTVTEAVVTLSSQAPASGELEVEQNNGHEANSQENILNANIETNNSMAVEPEALSSLPDTSENQADEANGVSILDTRMSHSGETRLNYVDYQILSRLKDDALLYARRIRVNASYKVKLLVHILKLERGHPNVIPLLEGWLERVIVIEERRNGNGETSRRPQRCAIREGYGNGKGLRGKAKLTEKVYLEKLYDRRGLKGVAQHVLRDVDGNAGADTSVDPKEMKDFWGEVFGCDIMSNTTVTSTSDEDSTANSIWGAVTLDDIKRTEMESKKAKGPDGVSVSAWKQVPQSVRALFYNVVLHHGVVLPGLSKARTVFIPKVKNPSNAGEYRPISITSVIQRQLHRIFVKRITAVRGFDDRQVAFRNGVDGVSDNLATLRTILEYRSRERRDLHIVSLDLKKAFDSVDHDAVFRTLSNLKCPTVFINYMKRLYSHAKTSLELSNGESPEVRIGRGVFQGDPLSPVIFNYIIDEALKKLDKNFGYPCGGDRLTCMAFADDITIVGDNVTGTQLNINILVNELARKGLQVNPTKCHSLSIVKDGHRKTSAIDTYDKFIINDQYIKTIEPLTKWKYLGIHFTGDKIDKQLPDITTKLERVSNALLKPQVKIAIISKIILPAIFHQAVLGNSSQEELSTIDTQVRKVIRKIMHFPHDLPNSYMHAPIRCGGMGIPELLVRIPILRYVRMKRFAETNKKVAIQFDRSIAFRHNQKKVKDFLTENDLRIDDKDIITKYYLACLDKNIATKGLSEAYHSRQTRGWSSNWSNEISGGDFIKYHLISSCSLPTLARRAWGRPEMDTKCRQGCSTAETAHHVLQECSRTHGGRVLRHDRVLNMIHTSLVRKFADTFTVEKEPQIQTPLGLRKPDLILHGGNEAVVIDLHIVGKENMREARCNKVAKYRDLPGLTRIIKERYSVDLVSYEAITISYCGIIERASREMLRVLDFKSRDIFRITTSVLRGSWLNWFQFKRTHQQRFFDLRSQPPG